mmetsp:Transcript_48553/g.125168  ORF Transcript_48553/g.125168 Transcript_48553/m.125168 type:complete len:296 (+) Transcript_48553:76-963(+)
MAHPCSPCRRQRATEAFILAAPVLLFVGPAGLPMRQTNVAVEPFRWGRLHWRRLGLRGHGLRVEAASSCIDAAPRLLLVRPGERGAFDIRLAVVALLRLRLRRRRAPGDVVRRLVELVELQRAHELLPADLAVAVGVEALEDVPSLVVVQRCLELGAAAEELGVGELPGLVGVHARVGLLRRVVRCLHALHELSHRHGLCHEAGILRLHGGHDHSLDSLQRCGRLAPAADLQRAEELHRAHLAVVVGVHAPERGLHLIQGERRLEDVYAGNHLSLVQELISVGVDGNEGVTRQRG